MAWSPPDPWSYSYLLGMYLGDGCVSKTSRSYQLVIACDGVYPDIIDDVSAAVMLTLLPAGVHQNIVRNSRCIRVVAGSKRWHEAFPQAAPGRKHERKIELAPWQREIVDRFPRGFLRGLLHSDGCRTINRFKTKLPSGRVAEYAYPRWFFTNHSADIRGLFCEYCERLGIRWTQSNPRNISISHRTSVALVDSFVPAKS
jgi:hypothetical protein